MIDKTLNKKRAEFVREIARKHGLAEITRELDGFIVRNDEYKAHILMIGGYSAGKSALLNKYIGKPILRENQGPETDIATELHFSENEYIVANALDGTKKKIDSVDEINLDETRNVEYHLNSENIRLQSDYIMVDTPGFDSGIEKHNKALMQYVDRGTAFFLVVDCEKGTISESTLNFLNEVSNYSVDIAVIINKCDKKIEEDVQKIKEHIENVLMVSTGHQIPVICASIYDDDISDKIAELISGFDTQELYDKNVTSELDMKCKAVINALEIIRENADYDTEEIEREISKRQEAKKRLLEQIEMQKKRMGAKLRNEVKERIMSKVSSQLMSNAEMLASAYKGGVECFQEKVIEIIRPIMICEVENYSAEAYEGFIRNLNYDAVESTGGWEQLGEIVENVYDKISELQTVGVFQLPVGDDDDKGKMLAGSGIAAYKAISSALAITTTAIAPPLELLIVFLPDIIKLLGTIFGGSKEQQLVDGIRNKVIPQIVSKIRNELDKPLSEVEMVMAESISANVQDILDIENNALEIAIQKKKNTENEYNELIASINNDIEQIRKQVK